MKSVIYCRVSSERQVKEGHGLDSQEKLCRDYAANKGYHLLKIFREEGLTGGLFERPAMKELLQFLDDHNNHDSSDKIVVIFDDLKRFARDLLIHFGLKKEIYSRNATVESPNFKFEDTPTGKFTEQVMAAAAELERNQNRDQVISKMKARVSLGYWPFCLPPGLINQKHVVHGKIAIPNEPYASIYKQAIEGFKNRKLLTPDEVRHYIEKEYKKQGIQRKISLNGANRILREILYAGYVEYPHWEVKRMKAKHDGFISIDTFNEVQDILNGRAKPKSRIDTNPDFPLRNLVLCSTCIKPLTASWNTSRNGQRYPNYFCKTEKCPLRWKVIHRGIIETQFEKLLIEKTPDDSQVGLTIEILTDVWTQKQSEAIHYQVARKNELQSLTESITNLTKRIAKTTDDHLIMAYEQEIKTLSKRHATLEETTGQPRYTKEQFGTASDKVITTLKEPVRMWKSDDAEERFTIFSMYFEEKPIYDKVSGFGTSSLSSPIKLFDAMKTSKNHYVEMPGNEPGSEGVHQKLLQA